ncbi:MULTISPECIES: TrmB family transcriptional regulator sugar-binding domain-containing protein [unclassified Streptomyces]|uniref:TrmB family transcriptional regulator sugar-binding domain-containing protein n=1 Tax=unclassified Streptomyces TaxID=2593676 RepID=UPI000B32D8EE|nr:TrmB family transcriptional regulator sugar-binding domain-containing protein [Streptomyces sp. TSRI0281]
MTKSPARGPNEPGGDGRRPDGSGDEGRRPGEPGEDHPGPAPDGGPERPGPGEGQDAIERALIEVRALIETTMERHRNRVSSDRQIVAMDGHRTEVLGEARKLVLQAVRSIDVVLASGPSCGTETKTHLRALIHLVPEGVRLRLLCSPAMIDEDFVREQRKADSLVDIRVARVPPLQGVIVDEEVGLVSTESPTGRRASLIRVPDVIHTLCTLYNGVWRNAVPADARVTFGDHCRTELARQILGALRAGVTDEVAARELVVSVRTYRRYVAEIMTLLDASSRFQAGVRAAELGLLGPMEAPGQSGPSPRGAD